MLVGGSGAGKSTCYKVLKDVMTELSKMKENDVRFAQIIHKEINPKAVTMAELYGFEDLDTREWKDGLASKIIRKFAK